MEELLKALDVKKIEYFALDYIDNEGRYKTIKIETRFDINNDQ